MLRHLAIIGIVDPAELAQPKHPGKVRRTFLNSPFPNKRIS
jgi:hypothetical protein